MELLFIILIGLLIGFAAWAVLPSRELFGVGLLPSIGGAVAAIVWVALTWAHWKWDGGWIWVVTILAATLAVVAARFVLAPIRTASDDRLFGSFARG